MPVPSSAVAGTSTAALNPVLLGAADAAATLRAMVLAGAATLATGASTGALLVAAPGDWYGTHAPAAATQATLTKAASGAGVRHIITSISATMATGATAQATVVQLVLRDGATGTGTIMWSKQIILPVNGVWEVNLSGLNIIGGPNTATTLEFSAAGVAGSFQSVSLTGHDAA